MSEIRALIEQLIAAGVDPIEAAEVVARAAIHGAANAPKQRSAGAIRQERYRRNKASQVTESDDSDAGSEPSSPEGSSPTAVDQVVTAFSEMARQSGLSVPRAVTASRRRSLLLRIEEHGLPAVLDAIERIGRSRFCRGENDRGWRADLDFLCQPKSFVSILEGKYDDRPLQQSQSPPRPQSPSMQRHHDIHARLKRELYGEPDDQFAGQTVDLAAGDFRSH
ncbi:DNA replication protein [Sinorhizobium meliloti]|uniref:DNA replication protein n=1 Tax=Rhizobium meliloti TaxID=382 RepID=UPI001F263173|nr:DNA replication protein [Sinorhizobium meliloti]